ncbi:hypothetical protein IWQ55_004303 [Labrenzia sp. EL_208]|nr:hypothetical protein [Labrenzia sp. EL_132]MBG6231079.1 hypothetical protein [Labrenzia sp. EL_208]
MLSPARSYTRLSLDNKAEGIFDTIKVRHFPFV